MADHEPLGSALAESEPLGLGARFLGILLAPTETFTRVIAAVQLLVVGPLLSMGFAGILMAGYRRKATSIALSLLAVYALIALTIGAFWGGS
jgi:hypothetical protein